MSRDEILDKIIDGTMSVTDKHQYIDDILFYQMLTEIAEEKEWYMVCSLAQTQIKHIENKQRIEYLKNGK
jgi:hypothetical protein